MSTSPDPQTWIFPPVGAPVLPSEASAAFGPISNGDKIKLEWAPAAEQPEIAFICANDGTTYTVSPADTNSSPYAYTFTQTINNGSTHICWMFFPGTSVGNTLTFQYDNVGTGSSVLWQQDSQVANALSGNGGGGGVATVTVTKTVSANGGGGAAAIGTGTVSTVTVTETEVITQLQNPYTTTVTNPSTTYVSTGFSILAASTEAPTPSIAYGNNCSSLSPAAGAGIGVAATAIFALLVLFCFLGSRRYRKREESRHGVGAGGTYIPPPNMTQNAGVAAAAAPASASAAVGTSTGFAGPASVPADYKYQPPHAQQQIRGYYAPEQQQQQPPQRQQVGQQMGQQSSLLGGYGAPRRTIHEVE